MKSFSVLTKEELCKTGNNNTEEMSAELAGILLFGAAISGGRVKLSTENADVFGRYRELCKALKIDDGEILLSDNSARYTSLAKLEGAMQRLLDTFEITDFNTGVVRYGVALSVMEDAECRRSFIKGAFLGGGTIIDPNKNYNLEIVVPYKGLSRDFTETLKKAGFDFKSVLRKSKYVLYIKNSETILDFLTYIGAYRAQMELINIKIEKEIRNDFNRSVNSETANIEKTINASVRQIQAIEVIEEKVGIDELPDDLRDLAVLRMKHKSESLGKLGKLLDPPLGKSGVNHRFNRIIAMAERLSEE